MSVHHLYRVVALPPKRISAGSWWASEQAQTREGFAKLVAEANQRLNQTSDRKLPDRVGERRR